MAAISVVIPCHNDGLFLRDAIESILTQSFKDWEIHIVDDGSTDAATLDVIRSLSTGIRTTVHSIVNSGPSHARNLGIGASSGRYVICLDADDLLHPEYLQKAFTYLESNADYGICYCKARRFGTINDSWQLPDYNEIDFAFDNCIFVTALMRREVWLGTGGFSETMKYGMEDYDFWLKAVSRGYKVHRLNEELFFYRIKELSRTTLLGSGPHELAMFQRIIENNIEYFCKPELVKSAHARMRRAEKYIHDLHRSRKWKVYLLLRHPKRAARAVVAKMRNWILMKTQRTNLELK